MFMVSNSKLNLYTYLAQGNLYKNSNAIEQAFFFLQGLHSTHFFVKTEYFNTTRAAFHAS